MWKWSKRSTVENPFAWLKMIQYQLKVRMSLSPDYLWRSSLTRRQRDLTFYHKIRHSPRANFQACILAEGNRDFLFQLFWWNFSSDSQNSGFSVGNWRGTVEKKCPWCWRVLQDCATLSSRPLNSWPSDRQSSHSVFNPQQTTNSEKWSPLWFSSSSLWSASPKSTLLPMGKI